MSMRMSMSMPSTASGCWGGLSVGESGGRVLFFFWMEPRRDERKARSESLEFVHRRRKSPSRFAIDIGMTSGKWQ